MAKKGKSIKLSEGLISSIEKSIVKNGQQDEYGAFSKWVREACQDKLLREDDISNQLIKELIEVRKIINGFGSNINQLARRANSGEPVIVETQMLNALNKVVSETKSISLKLLAQMND